MIEVKKISKEFELSGRKVPVFEDISFSVNQGEWICIIGPSGCGKTTLLHILGLLDTPTAGDVFYKENLYSSLTTKEKSAIRLNEIGFIFQAFHLFPELDALENVILPAMVKGVNRKEAKNKAAGLLEKVGMQDRMNHLPTELSGGEQQRVAVARALINNPSIILADEPTGNLDDENTHEIMKILSHLHSEHKKTIIMVTHLHSITKYAQKTLLLKDKLIKIIGPPGTGD
ncbi:MAG: ABC transporter ATP-binding protein [Verrucomicrobiota bacterium]|nr:ABC transporter ATP-binding protein [Verrucomicrobiota bacterium]